MRLLLSIALLAARLSLAQPAGLFVCRGFNPAPDREVNFPFVSGWLVRPPWSQIEPQDGRFDFSLVEKDLETARRLDKKIALMVYGGPDAPEWLYARGARSFTYAFPGLYSRRHGQPSRIPILWDEIYLSKWTRLVRRLGQRFAKEHRIAVVHISGATENGMEMQLPHSPQDIEAWRREGYAPEKAIRAWRRIIDAYAVAFPDAYLDIDVHPVLGSDRVAREVARYGRAKLGARFGMYGGWLSGRSASEDAYHADMHAIVRDFGARSFLDFQMIADQTEQPERFGRGGLEGAIRQGMSWGARYFEVWERDAMNPALSAPLAQLASEIAR